MRLLKLNFAVEIAFKWAKNWWKCTIQKCSKNIIIASAKVNSGRISNAWHISKNKSIQKLNCFCKASNPIAHIRTTENTLLLSWVVNEKSKISSTLIRNSASILAHFDQEIKLSGLCRRRITDKDFKSSESIVCVSIVHRFGHACRFFCFRCCGRDWVFIAKFV